MVPRLTSRALPLAVVALASVASVASAQATRPSGIDTANFDRSVRPQDDFFRFVNGGWLEADADPERRRRAGARSTSSTSAAASRMRAILEEAARSNAPAGSEERKVGDLYASFLDSARVESLGVTPLKGELARIAALKTPAELPALFAHLARIGVARPFGVGVGADPKKSSTNIVQVSQSGLGLPDRDYYLMNDARWPPCARRTRPTSRSCSRSPGSPIPPGAASRVLALETAIAGKQWDRARNRDRNATYNPMTVAQLARVDRRASTGRATSAPPAWARRRTSSSVSPTTSSRSTRSSPRRRSRTWREYLAVEAARRVRRRAVVAVRAGALRLPRQGAQRPAGACARAGSAA